MNEDRSRRYHRLKRRVAVLSIAITATGLALLLISGASQTLRNFAVTVAGAGASSSLTVGIYVVLLAALQDIANLPFAYYGGFVLERRYGLSSESLRAWVVDHVKGAAVAVVLAIGGAEIVYFTLRHSLVWWWVFSALMFVAAFALLARAAPVVLMPMFYRFKPLDRQPLRERLINLAARAGAPALGVYEWGLGRKTHRANAALVGTGGTRRILVSDTLLAGYTDDEIEVILAHELGHHVHRDILKGMMAEAVLLFGGFYAAAAALAAWWRLLRLASPADIAGLPLLLLTAGGVSLCATPALNALSRWNERRADRYALNITGQGGAFVSAMRRLASQNLAEDQPSALALWLFHTHPPIEQRIKAAGGDVLRF